MGAIQDGIVGAIIALIIYRVFRNFFDRVLYGIVYVAIKITGKAK